MTSGAVTPLFLVDFLFFFGFSTFRLVRFRFLIYRSWVTSPLPVTPLFLFLLFLVDFLFFGGFPVSYFFGFGGFPIFLFSLNFLFFDWCVFVLSISSRSL